MNAAKNDESVALGSPLSSEANLVLVQKLNE